MATTYSPSSGSRSLLDRLFALQERGTNAEREVIAGLATFMTMAYIIFVNPQILKTAGMPPEAVAAATCIAAAIPTLIMGFWANYPFALASGMGLNAALAMQATRPGMDWQTMMGVIVVEGAIVAVLVLTRVREQVMQAIPMNLKRAIGVGIGIFIAFLGLQHAGWVQKGPEGLYLTHGAFTAKSTLVPAAGLLLLMLLLALRVRGAILLGIVGTAVIAWVADRVVPAGGVLVTLPERWLAVPDFSTFAQANIIGALQPALVGVIFAFLITDFFDTMGTVIGIGGQGGFLDERGRLPRLNRVLLTDSLAAVWGGLCGASSVTTYIESASGISEGGRTGLTAVVVGMLFLLGLLFAPLVAVVPSVATAPALVIVGYLMIKVVHEMEFESVEEGIPAFLTMLLIPFTQSISFGIGIGFISYAVVMVLRGKASEVSPWMYGIALLFAVSFVWGV